MDVVTGLLSHVEGNYTEVPIGKRELVGFTDQRYCWLFAHLFFNPSYWLILKREGFSGNLALPGSFSVMQFMGGEIFTEVDRLLLSLGFLRLVQLYELSHQEPFLNQMSHYDLYQTVKDDLLRGRLKLFKLERGYEDKLTDDNSYLYSNPNLHGHGNPITYQRNLLAETLGNEIANRWLGKELVDKIHFDRWDITRRLQYAYDTHAAIGEAIYGTLKGLLDVGIFVVKVVGGEIKFQFELNSALANVAGHTLTRDMDAAHQALLKHGALLQARYDSQKTFVKDVAALAEKGYQLFKLLENDYQSRLLIYDFIDSYLESSTYRKSRTQYLEVGVQIGIEILIGIATAGTVAAARKGIQVLKAANTALKAKYIGPFPKKAIDQMAELATMIKQYSMKTEVPKESIRVVPAYKPRSDVKPLLGNTVHKRHHPDGRQADHNNPMDYGDPYTLLADGKPMGAKEGVMPTKAQGLEKLDPEHQRLIDEQGYPDVFIDKDYRNFSNINPTELKEGDKIYRIIDEKASPSGSYWATELPANKTAWRDGYAVKDGWNDNGYYVEHTVGKNGLKAWKGTTAGQKYDVVNDKRFYLEGGQQQLFIERNAISGLEPQITNWSDTGL